MLISCPLRFAALRTAHSVAISDATRSLTFAQFDQLVQSFCSSLAAKQLSAEDTCAILAQNSVEYAALFVALARRRAIAAPLNTRLNERELRNQLELLNPKLVLADAGNLEMALKCSSHPLLIDSILTHIAEPDELRNDIKLDTDQAFCTIFTSGSTGAPKGVLLSLGNVYYNALASNENLPLSSEATWLLSLPLFHVGGLGILFRCLLAKARLFVVSRFDPAEVNRLIDSGELSHLSLVPTMLMRLLESRGPQPLPPSFKAVLLGGGPVSPRLLEIIRDLQIPAVMSYGLTEAASQVTATNLQDPPARLTTSGRALCFGEVKIDTDSNVGEICVRGKIVCTGYVDGHVARNGSDDWLRTGDLGSLDQDGYLTVHGRKDEMFVSGGENIFPQEISAVAESLPEVAAAAVIPIEHELWGHRPVLFVEMSRASSFDEQRLRAHLELSLARYKLPDQILVLEQLPRTALGKVDRQQLLRIVETRARKRG